MNLTAKYRPKKLTDILGQPKLVGQDGIITKMFDSKKLSSCIFYGPPGCGKTTIARIFAKMDANVPYLELNATRCKLDDIRAFLKQNYGKQCILYLDEIQHFNKKQQQSLLPYIEDGSLLLIGATTDNPYYCCYNALLSRCIVLEFTPVDKTAIINHLMHISATEGIILAPEAAEKIADVCAGDVRRAINILDMLLTQFSDQQIIHVQNVQMVLPNINMASFDTNDDVHYSLISALQKSIRGSDPNAAIFYLARLLEGGDLLSPCRRLLVIANEDIGLGNPWAVPFVHACVESAKQLGLPEAKIPLSNAVICLAISPKCSTAESTYNRAKEDVLAGKGGQIPPYLHHACSTGYLYPHEYPYHWVRQQYLPDDIKTACYYVPDDNDFEQNMANYWTNVHRHCDFLAQRQNNK